MAEIIRANEVGAEVCKALGLEPRKVRRIVLDLTTGEPIMAYVEMHGDERLLNIKWKLSGAKVEFADKEE